jgi:hypothetical protein
LLDQVIAEFAENGVDELGNLLLGQAFSTASVDALDQLGLGHGIPLLAVVPVIILAFMASRDPWAYRSVFDLVILLGVFQVGVHAYGFIRKTQPLVEHLEIGLYALLSALAWLFYPQPPP